MKILLCGDLTPTDASVPAFEAGDRDALMGGVTNLAARCDFAIANLECALTDSEATIRKCGPNLKGRPAYARTLAECGFTHMGLSNNHTMDFGIQGMKDTEAAVLSAGMTPFGYGENDQDSRRALYLEKDGRRAAIIAVCEHEYSYALRDQYGANPFDPFDTMEDIAKARKQADYVIVMYHGGKEHCAYPSPRLRKACRAMARAGADLILCQHSHMIGCREEYEGSEIVYGQGNFHFLKYMDTPAWQTGLVAELTLENEIRIDYHSVATADSGIRLAEGTEKEEILDGFRQRSLILQDEEKWLAEWEAFCRSMPYYLDAAAHAFEEIPEGEQCRQVFPHYLDCEAHLDVWQTIFRTWHAEKKSGA